jgi:hypothetical protein
MTNEQLVTEVEKHLSRLKDDLETATKEAVMQSKRVRDMEVKCLKLKNRVAELEAENEALRKVIIGMFPMWINAMGYCEHGNHLQLDAMYRYYRGSENQMTNEDLKLMFSIIPEKTKGDE